VTYVNKKEKFYKEEKKNFSDEGTYASVKSLFSANLVDYR
jgi:hypothetical protein